MLPFDGKNRIVADDDALVDEVLIQLVKLAGRVTTTANYVQDALRVLNMQKIIDLKSDDPSGLFTKMEQLGYLELTHYKAIRWGGPLHSLKPPKRDNPVFTMTVFAIEKARMLEESRLPAIEVEPETRF